MTMPSYIDVSRAKIKNENSRFPNFALDEYLEKQGVKFRSRDADDHIEYSTNCPMCVERGEERPDTKGRLWVNPKLGTFFCYNCKWDGPLVRLIQHFSGANYESALRILKGKAPNPLEHLSFSLRQETFESDEMEDRNSVIKMPPGFTSFKRASGQSVFTEYLKYRGIPLEYAIENGWGFSEIGYTQNRIIVPTTIDGELVFWQARDVLEEAHPDWDSDDYRKVLNPKGVSAHKVLYNFDVAKDYDEIIICEGFIDAVKVGPNAVATNGKHLHPTQMELLTKTKAESVCILWDYDAFHDQRRKKNGDIVPCSVERAASMLRAYFEVRSVKLPKGRDPGSYEIGELDDLLY